MDPAERVNRDSKILLWLLYGGAALLCLGAVVPVLAIIGGVTLVAVIAWFVVRW